MGSLKVGVKAALAFKARLQDPLETRMKGSGTEGFFMERELWSLGEVEHMLESLPTENMMVKASSPQNSVLCSVANSKKVRVQMDQVYLL